MTSKIKGSAKVWWIIVILIIIIGGVWWWNASQSATAIAPATTSTINSPSDTSDAALNQDLSSVDSQMNGLQSDNTAVDQSLSSSTPNQ